MVRGLSRSLPLFALGAIDRRHVLVLGGGALALAAMGSFLGGPAFAAKTKPVKVAAIYTLALAQPWISRIHKALKAAEARGDITYIFSENVGSTDYEGVIRHYSQEGAELIVGDVFGVERPARKVAADYPKTAFLMGSSLGPTKPNFAVFDDFIHEPSYLTGMVAGRATRSNVIGLVAGYPIAEANRLMQAFMAGARSVNPQVKFTIAFINSWYDPEKAKEAAFAAIDKGADVLYAERSGVTDAAKARGVKAVGSIIDTSAQYPGTIIASALWHMEPTIERVIQRVIDGSFTAADYGPYSYMSEGGASLAPLDPKLVPPEVIEEVLAKEKEIKDGFFRVPLNETEPASTL
ncbi:MAG: basic rane lipoprotein [Xanthobacteraceae bacterium]|jgi:basic membrane lipoprotein Med (substrate-binding protein (PBP1-ABC) superfamily)|nr:basic rane lipoprotein [Xanthobacteraceae bacterium]